MIHFSPDYLGRLQDFSVKDNVFKPTSNEGTPVKERRSVLDTIVMKVLKNAINECYTLKVDISEVYAIEVNIKERRASKSTAQTPWEFFDQAIAS